MALALFSGTTYQSPVTSTGAVNDGGKVYFYEPGTSTPKDAYTTSDLSVATANPLILDSKGRGTAWLNGSYKIRVTDSADVLIDEEDNYNKGSSFDITAVTAARTMAGVDDTGSFTHSGTYTVSLTQASTLGAGWNSKHHNIGTGVITFARLAAANTINGSQANFTLQPGESVEIKTLSDTTGFVAVLFKPDLYATASGTDTYTCTFAPPNIGRYSGQKLRVRFTNANTSTTPTLNGVTITKEGSTALVAGDIPAGHEAELTDNGTNYVLGNPRLTSGAVPLARIQRAYGEMSGLGRIDLGTVVTGDVVIFSAGGSFTLSAAADGTVRYILTNAGTATVTFGGSATLPSIERTTNATGAGVTYYFLGSSTIKVTAGGTLVLGLSASSATGGTLSSNSFTQSALVLVGT